MGEAAWKIRNEKDGQPGQAGIERTAADRTAPNKASSAPPTLCPGLGGLVA